MTSEKNKTGKKVGKGNPPEEYRFKGGYDPRRGHRPKGKRSFKTDFELAAREIAKALRLGEEPEPIYIELMKQGIKSGLKGNYNFWKDITERIYGKEPDVLEANLDQQIKVEKEKELIAKEFEIWLKNKIKK